MAVFGYGRVSTVEQSADNQLLEMKRAGHEPDYWFAETGVSGKVPAFQRPQFSLMMTKMRKGETLVVSKLDRLGRDAIDVQQTVRRLEGDGIRVLVLSLGGQDLTSPTGKLMLTMLSAVAEMERDLLIERTQAGLQRAKAEGKVLGRPRKTSMMQRQNIQKLLSDGETVSAVARRFGISRATVITIREAQQVLAASS